MKHRPALAVLAALTLLLCAISCSAGTVYVKWDSPGPAFDGASWTTAFHTVQAGLNAAVSGDQVWVARGTYVERITLKVGVALYGGYAGSGTTRSIGTYTTTLDGSKAGSVVTCPAGATSTTRIDGFRIRNGSGTIIATNKYAGGGIYCVSSSPTIAGNTITGNGPSSYSADGAGIYCAGGSAPAITGNTIMTNATTTSVGLSGNGGGIYCNGSSPTITNNSFTANTAENGGGIYCEASSPTITNNNRFRANKALDGAGIHCAAASSPTIAGNTFTQNQANGGTQTGGGGIYCTASSPTIRNNAIVGNNGFEGGAICCYSSSAPVIDSNTMVANTAVGDHGGGIFCSGSSPTITNNTIVQNSAARHGGAIGCQYTSLPTVSNNIIAFNSSGIYSSSGTPMLRNNCVHGNTGYNYQGLAAGAGDISVDPMLADTAYGNVHIQPGSPCINAGDPGAAGLGTTDIDGQARVQGGIPDIGSDESNGATWNAGPYTIIRVSPTGSDSNNGSSWALAKKTVQGGLDTATTLGGEVWVKAGTYNERITLRAHTYLYGGFAGTETSRDERNWVANETILDGGASNTVVTATTGYQVNSVDGFTIRNGHASYGGGVYCSGSSPTITNNKITLNYAEMGGGLNLGTSSAIVTNNTITDNDASEGAGIWCDYGIQVITNNIITNNVASSSQGDTHGGGIHSGFSSAIISGNKISGNQATTGAGLYGYNASPTITNNWIFNNNALTANYYTGTGGGVYLYNVGSFVANNTIVGNSASGGSGGVMISGSPTFANNIVAYNSPSGIVGSDTPTLRNNCVYGNETNYSGISVGTGDISFSPLFVNRDTGDLHLDPWSPCINAGWNDMPELPSTDIDGQARLQDGVVDIGADEAEGTNAPPGPYAVIRVSTSGNDANDGSSWPSAKRTVQAAIEAAFATGGEVWVKAGTYVERITLRPYVNVYGGFAGTETSRWQRNWTASQSILDGGAGGSVVTATAGHRVSGIDGFTIRNGTGTLVNGSMYGGGIYCVNASPVISNNRITANGVSPGVGGGIYCKSCWPLITNNVIVANGPTSSGCGIYSSYASPAIANNIISGNVATNLTGGIFCEYEYPTITNNTITDNSAAYGGGLYCNSARATVANNILAFNSSGLFVNGTAPTLRNNCVYGNTAYNYAGITAGPGDISLDPQLVNRTDGDFHLTDISPCTDAGWNGAPGLPTIDMDGQSRVQDGTVDIGADEVVGTHEPPATSTIRVSPTGDDANNGSSWTLAKRTVQAAIDAATVLGGEVWIKAGTYNERITIKPNTHLYGGFTGTETSKDERNWTANVTILDGGAGGSVVTVSPGQTPSTVDGFTIRNGRADYGGGISCSGSMSTIIANNTITGNSATYHGGGMAIWGSLNVINNTISSNNAATGGGGIYIRYSSPRITGNTITQNTSVDGAGVLNGADGDPVITGNTFTGNIATGKGGGMYAHGSAADRVLVSSNTFEENSASYGGGVYLQGSDQSPLVENNTIRANTASYGGGAACADYCSAALRSNTIEENTASVYGGGLYCSTKSYPRVQNNRITANSAPSGGGVCASGELAMPYIVNNTIIGNTASSNGGGVCAVNGARVELYSSIIALNSSGIYSSSTYGVIQNNCVYGNTSYSYSGISAGTGNISADPMLVDLANGDYHLTALSPCIDAGCYVVYRTPLTDMDGETRTNGAFVDIGADEYWPTTSGPSAAKLLRDGMQTSLKGFTVSAAFDGFFYIETDDRTSGIRVDKAGHGVQPGNRVNVSGTIGTNAGGERYIWASAVTQAGTGFIRPILLPNRSVGGGDWSYDPITGTGQRGLTDMPDLSNIGMLVSTTGRVTHVGSGFFYLDDGSRLDDGSGYVGIKVSNEGESMPVLDSYVKVTGASSCYKVGSDLFRLIRASQISQ